MSAGSFWHRLVFARRHLAVPGMALPARPGLLVLTAGLLIGLCAVLTSWGARNAHPKADPAGFDLLADDSSLKLNNTSAEAPVSHAAAAPQPWTPLPVPAWVAMDRPRPDVKEEHPAVVQVAQATAPDLGPPPASQTKPLLPLPAPPVPVLEILPKRPVEPPPLPEPMVPLPSLPPVAPAPAEKFADAYRISQQGESPMMRTWKKLGLHTLLAAALTAAPVRAEEVKSSDTPAKPEDTAKMIKALENIASELKELRKDWNTAAAGATEQLKNVNDRMVELEKAISGLRTQMQTTKAFASPLGAAVTPAAGTGRIRLANQWPTEMTILVNGISHRLAPNQVEYVIVPSGSFSYEVLSVRPPVTRPLNAKEEYEITIR